MGAFMKICRDMPNVVKTGENILHEDLVYFIVAGNNKSLYQADMRAVEA